MAAVVRSHSADEHRAGAGRIVTDGAQHLVGGQLAIANINKPDDASTGLLSHGAGALPVAPMPRC